MGKVFLWCYRFNKKQSNCVSLCVEMINNYQCINTLQILIDMFKKDNIAPRFLLKVRDLIIHRKVLPRGILGPISSVGHFRLP